MDRLVHWEIPVTDVKKAAEFYTRLFGWKMQGWSDDYMLFDVEEGIGGALMKVDKMPEPAIRIYVGVSDVAVALKQAEGLGAKTVQPKTEIGGGMGFAGSFHDPWGCLIGLWSKA
jgi:hypothetical protein